jgi:hypothetical protein
MRLTGLIAAAVVAAVPAAADRLFSPAGLQFDLATLRNLLGLGTISLRAVSETLRQIRPDGRCGSGLPERFRYGDLKEAAWHSAVMGF